MPLGFFPAKKAIIRGIRLPIAIFAHGFQIASVFMATIAKWLFHLKTLPCPLSGAAIGIPN